MKGLWKEVLVAAVLGIVTPWLVVGIFEAWLTMQEYSDESMQTATETTVQYKPVIQVYMEDQIMELPMEEYIAGVLLCELPEDFALETKKAQAVVARTYALRVCTLMNKHPGRSVCTSPDCCQGYTPPQAYTGTDKGREEATRAAEETAGLVLLYEGVLIDATYFSCSGGQTEDAVAVWGADVPYLRSVESPGEEGAAHYTDTVSFSITEFKEMLGLDQQTGNLFGEVTYTNGGGVKTMEIAGKLFTGTQLRSLLDLRSTAFKASAVGSKVIITTKGFGHRVGMSQYGAEAMAVSGKSFHEILEHYYVDTKLQEYRYS